MKNQKLFQKVVLIALVILVLFALVAPAIFAEMPAPKPPQTEKLLNGLKVLMWPDRTARLSVVNIRVHAGSSFDPQGKEGVMQLLADNIFPNEAAREFFKDDLGGSLEIVTNYDYIQINASSKPEEFLRMLETLATAVSSLDVDKETTSKLKAAHLARLAAVEKEPAYIADRAVAQRLFGTFPYGRAEMGTSGSLAKIDYADLIDARQRFLTADNATIAVSGNFDRNLGFRAIRRYFGGWLKSDRRIPTTFRQPDEPNTVLVLSNASNAASTELRFAIRGLARSDADFAASRTLAMALQARFFGPMAKGDITNVAVRSEAHTQPGALIVSFSMPPRDDAAVRTASADLSKKIMAELTRPLTADEFARARAQAQMEMSEQSQPEWFFNEDTFKLASGLAEYQAFQNVTNADVQRVATRLAKNAMVSVAVVKPTQ